MGENERVERTDLCHSIFDREAATKACQTRLGAGRYGSSKTAVAVFEVDRTSVSRCSFVHLYSAVAILETLKI